MLVPSFRIRCLACGLLAMPLAVLAVLAWAQDRTPSKEPVTNSLGMKLALIPAGKFTMGSPESEKGRFPNEEQHEVEIKEPFLLGIHEVRVRDFRAFVEDDGYKTEAETAGDKYTWKNPDITQTEDHPVVLGRDLGRDQGERAGEEVPLIRDAGDEEPQERAEDPAGEGQDEPVQDDSMCETPSGAGVTRQGADRYAHASASNLARMIRW